MTAPTALEMLEPRRLLAGDVQVVPNAFAVSIIGDDAGNAIRIEADGSGGWQVRGLDGTTVNGGNEPVPVFSEGLTPVLMNGGRDEVIINGADAAFSQSFAVEAGSGDDSVLVQSASNAVVFDGGLGRDWLGIYDSQLTSFSGTGGGGRDTLEVRRTIVAVGDFVWSDRSGPGGIFIEDSTFGTPTFGPSDFSVAQADASTSAEDPTAPFPAWVQLLNSTFTGPGALTTGPGDDTIRIQGNTFATGDIDLFTDEGDDEVVR